MKRVGTLEVHEDLAFQKKEWVIERMGWVLLLLIIAGSLAGLFGSGPLSSAHAATRDGKVRLDYSRITRLQAPGSMKLQMDLDETRQLTIPGKLMEIWKIQRIDPPPERATSGPEGTTYVFNGQGIGQIFIEYEATKPGVAQGVLRFPGGQVIDIRQMVLP